MSTVITGSNSRTYYFGEDACFCHAKATRGGRCDYHAGMWDILEAFQQCLTKDEIGTMDFMTGWIVMQHVLFCEGFPEFKDF